MHENIVETDLPCKGDLIDLSPSYSFTYINQSDLVCRICSLQGRSVSTNIQESTIVYEVLLTREVLQRLKLMSRAGSHKVIVGNLWEIYVRSRGARGTKGMTNKLEKL